MPYTDMLSIWICDVDVDVNEYIKTRHILRLLDLGEMRFRVDISFSNRISPGTTSNNWTGCDTEFNSQFKVKPISTFLVFPTSPKEGPDRIFLNMNFHRNPFEPIEWLC